MRIWGWGVKFFRELYEERIWEVSIGKENGYYDIIDMILVVNGCLGFGWCKVMSVLLRLCYMRMVDVI